MWTNLENYILKRFYARLTGIKLNYLPYVLEIIEAIDLPYFKKDAILLLGDRKRLDITGLKEIDVNEDVWLQA